MPHASTYLLNVFRAKAQPCGRDLPESRLLTKPGLSECASASVGLYLGLSCVQNHNRTAEHTDQTENTTMSEEQAEPRRILTETGA